jgi:DNA-binding NtrC family response regulator
MNRRIGKFEEANGGTLLLDEISEMDVRMQAKLLRAIQEREIDRVGGSAPVKIDIRILATSNRDLPAEIKAGNFREDLYFRLNVINLMLPSLRERHGDIALLADYFIEKYSTANGMPARKLSDIAAEKMEAHHWNGNVRELENTMHRAVLMATGNEIDDTAIMLPDTVSTNTTPKSDDEPIGEAYTDDSNNHLNESVNSNNDSSIVGKTVAAVEKELITQTLDHCLGNRTHAANILGISIRTLRNKLKQYGEGE